MNQGFLNLARYDAPKELTEEEYLPLVEESVNQGYPIAYIVNAILSYTEIPKIPEVVNSVMEGLTGFEGRVAFVFGVNAPESKKNELKAAMTEAQKTIDSIGVPVGLVESTYEGKFPYGTMRNEVLHSDENKQLIRAFNIAKRHPYISVQDFDTGSRTVPSGEHVFNYFENALKDKEAPVEKDQAKAEAEEAENKPLPPTRPLLITGGYRPGSADDLIRDTRVRFEKDRDRPPIPQELTDEAQMTPFVKNFEATILEDMSARERLGKIHPLLPYAPEPNLFLDALPGNPAATPCPCKSTCTTATTASTNRGADAARAARDCVAAGGQAVSPSMTTLIQPDTQ